jgi:predicted lipoprotein with Yx(FWY)xxD motif
MRKAGPKVLRLWVAVLGVGLAGMVGVATAGTPPTLGVFNSTVTNFNTQKSFAAKIVGASGGFAVYTLTGDSPSHPQCKTTKCRMIWPWVTIANGKTPTKNPLIKAKLGVWKHNGIRQLTLGGHPLYFFFLDKTKKRAHGEAIASFGGTWHVWKIGSSSSGSSSGSTPMPSPTPSPYPTTTSTPMPTPTPTPTPSPSPYPYP